mmetsp:Transcript_20689/g.55231  ORF Transcript_20689/g.55231 Transcript_20689/m.55231 type:complete len:346 (-) Transcript_20689:307-1344(-)
MVRRRARRPRLRLHRIRQPGRLLPLVPRSPHRSPHPKRGHGRPGHLHRRLSRLGQLRRFLHRQPILLDRPLRVPGPAPIHRHPRPHYSGGQHRRLRHRHTVHQRRVHRRTQERHQEERRRPRHRRYRHDPRPRRRPPPHQSLRVPRPRHQRRGRLHCHRAQRRARRAPQGHSQASRVPRENHRFQVRHLRSRLRRCHLGGRLPPNLERQQARPLRRGRQEDRLRRSPHRGRLAPRRRRPRLVLRPHRLARCRPCPLCPAPLHRPAAIHAAERRSKIGPARPGGLPVPGGEDPAREGLDARARQGTAPGPRGPRGAEPDRGTGGRPLVPGCHQLGVSVRGEAPARG